MLIPRMRGKAELKKGKDRPLVMQLIRRHCVPLHAVALDPSSTGKAKFTGGTVSESGRLLLLDAHTGKGKATYFTEEKPDLALPGISGAPLFALRDTLDWIGTVRSGCGTPLKGYSILATPSGFVGADGSY